MKGELAAMPPANVIAIDGPAASGKSTVASKLAERFAVTCVNTGAMFRAVAWKMAKAGIDPDLVAPDELKKFLDSTALSYESAADGKAAEVRIDGVFPGCELRTSGISAMASKIAVRPEVRTWLLAIQRALAGRKFIVMEGRDIGTAVFPDAMFKFFLTASPEVRARRRILQDGGECTDAETARVAAEIAERDRRDSLRETAPLKQASDAVLVDNSEFSLTQTLELFNEKMKLKGYSFRKTVLKYRVPYADTDNMGVVYYANYLKYFEMFRTEFMLERNFGYKQFEQLGFALPVIEAVCRYKRSARFEDMLSITGWISECAGVRLKIDCQVWRGEDLLAEGHTVHACLGANGRPVRMPGILSEMPNN